MVSGQGVGKFDISSDKRKELSLQVRPFNLEERGIRPKTSDMVDDFREMVDRFQPNLIAMSCVEDTFPQGLHLLNQIRDRKIPTLVGGVRDVCSPTS